MVFDCKFCSRVFSTGSNRIRHERLFHGAEDTEEQHEDEEMSSEDEEEEDVASDDESSEDDIDVWPMIVTHAAKKIKLEKANMAIREPYLSEFVDHMKDYAEAQRHFVKALEADKVYSSILEEIDENEDPTSTRDEKLEVAELAWQNKRFKVKRVIAEHLDLVNQAIQEAESSDEEDDTEPIM